MQSIRSLILVFLASLVVGGHRFLRYGEYLNTHLYDAREFMEAPTPVVFFSSDDVEDDPTAPVLIGLGDPQRVNYRVLPGAVYQRVLQTLACLPVLPRTGNVSAPGR